MTRVKTSPGLAFLALTTLATTAAAHTQPVHIDLALPGAEDAFVFTAEGDEGDLQAEGTALVLRGPGQLALTPNGAWNQHARPDKGWWVEWTVTRGAGTAGCVELHIVDGSLALVIRLGDDGVTASDGMSPLALPTDTSGSHTWRVARTRDGTLRIQNDEQQIFEGVIAGPPRRADRRLELHQRCAGGAVAFQRLRYATYEHGQELADPDEDGTPNAEDACPELFEVEQELDGWGYGARCPPEEEGAVSSWITLTGERRETPRFSPGAGVVSGSVGGVGDDGAGSAVVSDPAEPPPGCSQLRGSVAPLLLFGIVIVAGAPARRRRGLSCLRR